MGLQTLLRIVAAGVLALWVARPAEATTIDYTVTFGASDFSGTPPVGFVLGEFTLSFDPSANVSGSATTNFLNLTTGPVGFAYISFFDALTIGGTLNDVFGLAGNTDDFSLRVDSFSTNPVFAFFNYTQASSASGFTSTNGAVHVSSVATTPIPAALPLFLSAIGGLGFLGWRRRKSRAE